METFQGPRGLCVFTGAKEGKMVIGKEAGGGGGGGGGKSVVLTNLRCAFQH